MDSASHFALGPFLIVLLYAIFLGISIYCLILFIKLAHRGIKALDIFIKKNSDHLK